jgi:hypothetical protein
MSSLKKSAFICSFTALLCFALAALPYAASAYDAAADFSIGSNPNGVWSYGWSSTLGSAFTLETSNTTAAYGQSGLEGWLGTGPDGVPSVLYNSTANSISIGGHTNFQPGQLAVNPGTSGEYYVVRWTAPSNGQFTIAATFSGLSTVGDSSDVHILLNGVSLFDSAVNGSPSPTPFSGIQNVTAGDHIDFAVGWGSNGNQHDDTTGLAASIVAVPCPNIIGTWSGQVNVANPFSGYTKTTLSLHVTDQNTNGCLLRGYVNTASGRGKVPWACFNTGGVWGNVPFTGTILDPAGVVLNFGIFGQGSAVLDMTQTPHVMKKFILLSTAGAANGGTAVGDLTLEPSGP